MSLLRFVCTLVFCMSASLPAIAEGEGTEREGGILGTGIVGTITALGSIYVNGQHILFDDSMEVAGGVSVTRATELQPGHTVAVIAHPDGERWNASHIRQITPLTGPIKLSSDGGYSVLGTVVEISNGQGLELSDGDWVAISGLWQGDKVLATRIDAVSADTAARIEGSVLSVAADKPIQIGQTLISGLMPQHLSGGDVVRAEGKSAGNALEVRQLEVGVFDTAPGVIFAEGYLSPPEQSGLYTVLGSSIVSYTNNPDMIDPTIRYVACGENGELTSMIELSEDVVNLAECATLLGRSSKK